MRRCGDAEISTFENEFVWARPSEQWVHAKPRKCNADLRILDQQTLKDRVSARTYSYTNATMASAIENQAATIIQEAWRKYDSTRWKYSVCDTGNCGECDGCYYESLWCCPYCGDQCDYKEIFKGYCSEQCLMHVTNEYINYNAQSTEEEPEEDHSESESDDDFEPCDRCGRNASGQGYPGGSYCSRVCFVYYD